LQADSATGTGTDHTPVSEGKAGRAGPVERCQLLPVAANLGQHKRFAIPGAFRSLLDRDRQAVAEIDERAPRINRSAADDAGLRYVLAVDARERQAIMRRIEAMECGEPQLVPVADVRKLPGAEGIGFLAPVDLYEVTSEEYAQTAWTVRVYSNDMVEVGQTRAQAQRQSELIGQGYRHGYISDDGDWQPTAFNPATGAWQDIRPGDVVIQGGSVTQVEDGTFTQTDAQRIGNLFRPTPDASG
jgi:hypothetical protein